MNKIRCPKCDKIFQIDETSHESILKEVIDGEFNRQINLRKEQCKIEKENEIEIAEAHIKEELQKQIFNRDIELSNLKNQVANIKEKTKIN